ncbi:hypothetical protein [Streptomyces purpureus]|uniref:Heparin binding hemagglutinin HbhA n=1 Tax=Streptomyces purpureus TaxID=1951 RepID=A0A918LVB6_9ACTN|nr:hypothetical protein [Streptomyces purpureus]GGT55199.1 hypothetical protein GCM10014713_56130 [Streptomyces purpureus]
MAIIEELRTPLYFAAGTADLAVQQARKVPGLIEQLAAEAPARIEAVRSADPKAVQEKVTTQAKEAGATVQAKVTEVLGSLDTDLKKFGETAQDLALRGVGVAAEYAVKAREKYEEVAAHGEEAVKAWRGGAAEEIVEIAVAVEPNGDEAHGSETKSAANGSATAKSEDAAKARQTTGQDVPAQGAQAKKAPARKATARKAPAAEK